jgi:signal transduction histidine kinase
MKPLPLRLKITLWAVVVGGLGIALFVFVAAVTLHRIQIGELDRTLRLQANDFFASLDERGAKMDWNDEVEVRGLFRLVRSLFAFEVEQPPGTLVYRSRAIGDGVIVSAGIQQPHSMIVNGRDTRVLEIRRKDTLLRVASDMEPLYAAQRAHLTLVLVFLPVCLLLIALGGSFLSKKALRPVEEVATAAARMGVTRLDQRLPEPAVKDEIGNLTIVLNAMFDRIRHTVEQSRRFSADASHELKTPLTIIRAEIESALRMPDLPPHVVKMILNLQEETGGLIHIVESLLLLSQADAGRLKLQIQEVDMSAMLAEMIGDVEILAEPYGVTIETEVAAQMVVSADPQMLRQLMLNLFDNAVKYNEPDGRIVARLFARGENVVFTVANTGVEIPEEDRGRIFDRFHRVDRSRNRARGGQGLGLSICQEISRAHRAELVLVPSEPGWTCFQFSIERVVPSQSGFFRAAAVARSA